MLTLVEHRERLVAKQLLERRVDRDPGIRQRTSRPSMRVSRQPQLVRAASHSSSGAGRLDRRCVTRTAGSGSQGSSSGGEAGIATARSTKAAGPTPARGLLSPGGVLFGRSSAASRSGYRARAACARRPGRRPVLSLPRRLAGAAGVALTFDDGPHPEGTPAVLELLAAAGLRAVFFLVGEQVEQRPELAARMPAPVTSSPCTATGTASSSGSAALRPRRPEARGGRDRGRRRRSAPLAPAALRHLQPLRARAAARNAGMDPLLWSRWGKDWRKFTTPERIAARATRDLAARRRDPPARCGLLQLP